MTRLTDMIRTIQDSLLTILFLMFLLLFIPLFLLLIVLPLFIWRSIVKFLSEQFCKNHAKILHSLANLSAVDYPEIFETAANSAMCASVVFDGTIQLDEVRGYLREVVETRMPNSDAFRYPELRQTITSFLGYHFWEWDTAFAVENHANMYTGPGKVENIVFEQDMPTLCKDFMCEPFTRGRSPWEIWVWHGARLEKDPMRENPKTIVVIRFDHLVCDAFGLMKMFFGDKRVEEITTALAQKIRENYMKKSWATILMEAASLVWRIPNDLIKHWEGAEDGHEWNLEGGKLTGKLVSFVSEPIPLEFVKEIKNLHGTSFQTIVAAGMTGGLRNFMVKRKIKVTNSLSCYVALPMMGHPSKLRNHGTAIITHLPIGVAEPRDRVRRIHLNMKSIGRSTVPLTNFQVARLWCSFPIWALRLLALPKAPTCVFSNLPGPLEDIYFGERKVEDIQGGSGIQRRIGVGLFCVSYKGYLRVGVRVDEAISQDPTFTADLLAEIVKELHVLKAIEIV